MQQAVLIQPDFSCILLLGHQDGVQLRLTSRDHTAGKQHLRGLKGWHIPSCTGESTGLSAILRCTMPCMRRSWPRLGRSSCSARRAQTRLTGCAASQWRLSLQISISHSTILCHFVRNSSHQGCRAPIGVIPFCWVDKGPCPCRPAAVDS